MRTDNGRNVRGGKRNGERGAIAILMFVLLTVVMGFGALGFDLSYVRLARQEMQNATDAATHAAMVMLQTTNDVAAAKQIALDVAKANTVMGQPMILKTTDVVFGAYDFNTKAFVAGSQPYTAVQIKSQSFNSDDPNGLIHLTFAPSLGYKESDVSQSVTGAFSNRYFMVEMDVTDSYICDIDNAADAATTFLDYLYGSNGYTMHGTRGDWTALDTFTGTAVPLTDWMNIMWKHATIDYKWRRDTTTLSSSQGRGIGVCNKSNAIGLGGTNKCNGAAYANHNWMNACSGGSAALTAQGLFAGTDLAEAIKAGTTKLTTISQPYEARVLILVTDGTPMACTGIGGGGLCGTSDGSGNWQPCCANGLTCSLTGGGDTWVANNGNTYGGGAYGDGHANSGASGIITPPATATGGTACTMARTMLNNATAAADAAAAAGIDLFVIGFFNSGSREEAFAQTLKRNRGTVNTTHDSTQLAAFMKQIPGQIPVTIVQ
jgi:Putative Flp pilus-assembly TadE/G-like